MGCSYSISNNKIKHMIVKTHNIYVTYVFINCKWRILCKTPNENLANTILAKFYADPGAFSFRKFENI